MKSSEMKGIDAIAEIEKMNSVEEVNAFVDGDDRKTIRVTAKKRIKRIREKDEIASDVRPEERGIKQGEQIEPITQTTSDFKEGLQKTKEYVTGEDVIETLRGKGIAI